MIGMMDRLVSDLRLKGAQHMMIDAAPILKAEQRKTAFAVAAEIMRSDGTYQEDEVNILDNLASVLELDDAFTLEVVRVMNVLHSDLLA